MHAMNDSFTFVHKFVIIGWTCVNHQFVKKTEQEDQEVAKIDYSRKESEPLPASLLRLITNW